MSQEQALEAREKHEVREEGTRPGPVFRPEIDVLEHGDGYVIYADLPGVDERSVRIRFDNGTLTLDAQLATHPGQDWSPLHTEYRVGSYYREFRLSDAIHVDAVAAKMRDGVLELQLPKTAQRQPRQIAVHAG